jgi:hypothetical protein
MGRRALPLVAVGVVLLAVAPSAPAGAKAKRRPAAVRLHAFASCAELVTYARRNLGRSGGRVWAPLVELPATPPSRTGPGAEGAPAPTSAPGSAGIDYSTTNNQEQGVDEPDVVKTDGDRIYAVAGSRLFVIDARAPKLLGSLALGDGYGHELLLRGHRLLVVSRQATVGPQPVPVEGAPPTARASLAPIASQSTTKIADVDVGDPSAPKLRSSLTVDGDYVAARLNGAIARVVVSSSPLAILQPQDTTRVSGWLPRAVLAKGGRRTVRRAANCRAVRRPPTFSGLGMLTVLTVDLSKGLPAIDSDAIMSDAQTVYGSAKSLYVATQRWYDPLTATDRPPEGVRTLLHRFDATDPTRTDYRASGEVAGYLLNQFSISEFRGVLRVATTEDPVWANGQRAQDSQSSVTVLDQHGSRLDQVGRVSGLGRGERIYSVRFIEDAGYVVTFRQVDPLHTLDLSDAEHPRLRGTLDLLGYSAYLHPVGRDLILGVGRSATPEGRLRGVQANLFDVSDLNAPKTVGHYEVDSSSSTDVEADHKAFLFWGPAKLAVLPLQIAGEGANGRPGFVGALGLRLDRARGVVEAGRVVHDRDGPATPVQRALVVGPRLFTLSERGLLASSLTDLAPGTWVPFPTT